MKMVIFRVEYAEFFMNFDNIVTAVLLNAISAHLLPLFLVQTEDFRFFTSTNKLYPIFYILFIFHHLIIPKEIKYVELFI